MKDSLVDPDTDWTRRKLQILLASVVVVTLALATGGILSVVRMLGAGPDHTPTNVRSGTTQTTVSARDQLAEQPLGSADLEQAQPGTLSGGTTRTLQIPAPTRIGPAHVPSGFPHTPQGAMAQLVAIDQAAIEPASIPTAQSVIDHWAAPGGPTSTTWSGVKAVAGFLTTAGLPAGGSGGVTVTVEATMGLIKGFVGDDFVVPCLDLVITASPVDGTQPQRVAAADCQRMTWHRDRWLIGAGHEPAPAPSLWPGTQESLDAGYRWLEVSP